MKTKFLKFLSLILISSTFFSCIKKKNNPQNKTKSIEAIANNNKALRDNQVCGPIPRTAYNAQDPEDLVREIYNIAPPLFKNIVGQDVSSFVRFFDFDPQNPQASICSAVLNQGGQNVKQGSAINLEACWKIEVLKNNNQTIGFKPFIYLANYPANPAQTKEVIKGNFLGMVFYLFFEFYGDKLLQRIYSDQADIGADLRLGLAKAAIDDMSRLVSDDTDTGVFMQETLNNFLAMYGASDFNQLTANPDFQNFIAAEVGDSFYCAQDTFLMLGGRGFLGARQYFQDNFATMFGPPAFMMPM